MTRNHRVEDELFRVFREQNFRPDDIRIDNSTSSCHVTITKKYGMNKYAVNVSLTDGYLSSSSSVDIAKYIAHEAIQAFDEEINEHMSYGSSRISVSIERGVAECLYCGTSVSPTLSRPYYTDSMPKTAFPFSEEYRNLSDFVESDRYRKYVKAYLIGKLRYTCDPDCPNAAHSAERFKYRGVV